MELAAWLRLTLVPGVGGEARRALLKAFGLPQAIFAASPRALSAIVDPVAAERLLGHECSAEIDAALDWAASPGNRLLTLADADYPQSLLSSDDPPILLYAKGDTRLLNRPMLAVVGSRNATAQGERDAEAFARALGEAGLTIVSGLALGIDAAAHRGALPTPAGTVAVIGTGADRLYPAKNEALARRIAEKGVVLSEFALGTPALASNFPRRNRIIAGLGLGCLVVEAALKSGSLITARLAAESGREVFAIPGSIHSPLSRGCHQLIRQGAKLVEAAQDILEELRWESASAAPAAADRVSVTQGGSEEQVLAVLGDAPCALDTLSARSGLTPADLLAMLLPMELAGRVAQLPGGLYQRLH
ncbi:DNA-processing protein DprA [Sulfuritalea sp.]|uniref:DNA-processing protein DprA n=1 Tax=Sulfuritalea sp. TaxID=2480090 RepID=UPI00286E62E5|nr:DNA-processing protein DprA [Sulfuritalea sp.]